MSAELMRAVLVTDLDYELKLMLIAVVSHVNERLNGYWAFPGTERLVWLTQRSRSTVKRHLDRLEQRGIIKREMRRSTRGDLKGIRVNLEAFPQRPSWEATRAAFSRQKRGSQLRTPNHPDQQPPLGVHLEPLGVQEPPIRGSNAHALGVQEPPIRGSNAHAIEEDQEDPVEEVPERPKRVHTRSGRRAPRPRAAAAAAAGGWAREKRNDPERASTRAEPGTRNPEPGHREVPDVVVTEAFLASLREQRPRCIVESSVVLEINHLLESLRGKQSGFDTFGVIAKIAILRAPHEPLEEFVQVCASESIPFRLDGARDAIAGAQRANSLQQILGGTKPPETVLHEGLEQMKAAAKKALASTA